MTIEDLTDDQIVNAVASYGLCGLPVEEDPRDGEGCYPPELAAKLGIPTDQDWDLDLHQRMLGIDRLDANYTNHWAHLTPAEWARRLVGKSEAEIAALLKGTQ